MSWTSFEALFHLLDQVTGGHWSEVRGERGHRHAAVGYGPGRGLYLNAEQVEEAHAKGQIQNIEAMHLTGAPGAWVVTRGVGKLGASAAQRDGQQRPTLHCSSFTNLLLGVYTNAQEAWTHAGNMPTLEKLCETGDFFHTVGPGRRTRVHGYIDFCRQLEPDGSSAASLGLKGLAAKRYFDAEEVWRRREEFGLVTLFSQCTRLKSGWKMEHHTGVFLRLESRPDILYRIAADGSKSSLGYSGEPMDVEIIDQATALRLENNRMYALWAVEPPARMEAWESCCPTFLEA